MDLQKLKYDLALQCALVETLKEQSSADKLETNNLRISMLKNFKSYYSFYQALHDSNFEDLKDEK